MTDNLLALVDGGAGRLRLNRPRAIHALTLPMCTAMIEALQGWRGDDAVEVVLIDHAEGRGFCAGGDVIKASTDAEVAHAFFHEEYRLNHLLFTYAKPTVAFMDGVTMGGGRRDRAAVQISDRDREHAVAMPETGIGLFPDVGGGWYLSRLEGAMGEYLALTGARLDGAECHALGLASHYVPIGAARCAQVGDRRRSAIDRSADREAVVVPPPASILGKQDMIDRLFAHRTYEDVLAALAADKSDWAEATLGTLRRKSAAGMQGELAAGARRPRAARFRRRDARRIWRSRCMSASGRISRKAFAPCWSIATIGRSGIRRTPRVSRSHDRYDLRAADRR